VDLIHTDRAIAKRLLAGDEETFQRIFDEYFPKLYRFALARLGGDREEAKEIVQQTFCKAIERLDTYRGEASLYGWMLRICRNCIIDFARRQKRVLPGLALHDAERSMQDLIEAMRAPPSDQPEERAIRVNLQQLIVTALDYLPAHYGDILEWKYVEELSVSEIAERLDVGPKAAESRLTRARAAFREAILSINDAKDLLPAEAVAVSKG
jgi:RNA polymerase sigma-70 factor (ECF subfamily)